MNADQLLRFTESAVVGGLIRSGSPSVPFTIRLDEPLTREAGLTIWDEIHLSTGVHALVIDGAGCPWSRLLEAWP